MQTPAVVQRECAVVRIGNRDLGRVMSTARTCVYKSSYSVLNIRPMPGHRQKEFHEAQRACNRKPVSLHVLDAEKIASGPGAVVKDCVIHIMAASGARNPRSERQPLRTCRLALCILQRARFRDETERGGFFNCSPSILIAAAWIALEPSKQISRVETAGSNQNDSCVMCCCR